MPAAAVIPAPVAYIEVVAVKKLVVEILYGTTSSDDRAVHPPEQQVGTLLPVCDQALYLEQIRVLQAGVSLNSPAWNNRRGLKTTVGVVVISND